MACADSNWRYEMTPIRCPCGRFLGEVSTVKAELRLRCVKCGSDVMVYIGGGRLVIDIVLKARKN